MSDASVAPRRTTESFEEFLEGATPGLRRAFFARYGTEFGNEALADATAWAWEHRESLGSMGNPVGYLFRVGQTSVRAQSRRRRRFALPVEDRTDSTASDAGAELHTALERLTPDQRVAVLMVHAHGYSYAETAATLDISVAAVRNHVHRGMQRLRRHLED
jgi:RNA polymerase sigma-70 factor (ECF subfamily)